MQEQVSASLSQMSELSASGNTPSLDAVRDKIERRYANALGQAELANDTMAGRLQEVKRATANLTAQSRLAEIRASMAGEQAGRQAVTAPVPAGHREPAGFTGHRGRRRPAGRRTGGRAGDPAAPTSPAEPSCQPATSALSSTSAAESPTGSLSPSEPPVWQDGQ